tara:strand:+ start:2647 stop:2832 length:186 start_codon:yes stop_codon:yes gene_type:complete
MTTDKTFQLVQTWGPLGEGSKIETVYGDIDHNGPYSLVLGIYKNRKEAFDERRKWEKENVW